MALATGLRSGEILKMEWSEVDLKRRVAWIPAEKSKSFSARTVPLNELAIRVIQERIGTHPKYVFTRNGAPQRNATLTQKCFNALVPERS